MMAKELIQGLHENLWSSLRHIFNTDRIALGVAYLVNFSAFLLLLGLLPEKVNAAVISLFCLCFINALLFVSLKHSKEETLATMATLVEMYKDNELGKYFNVEKAAYYSRRYNLWLILVPGLMVFAVVLALTITYAI